MIEEFCLPSSPAPSGAGTPGIWGALPRSDAGSTALVSRLAILPASLPEAGQGLVEYALILALVAVMAIVALMFLGDQVSTTMSTVGGQL